MATPAKKIDTLSNRDKDNKMNTNNRLEMANRKKRSLSPEHMALSESEKQMRKLMDQRWKHVVLKDEYITDWKSFFECCKMHGTVSLDITGMKIPEKANIDLYWSRFCTYLKLLKSLKVLKLWRCPIRTVNAAMISLPELEVLVATTIQNHDSKTKYTMPINVDYLGDITMLTEVRLKGLSELNIISMKPFDKLVNLKILSLTSIGWYPKNVYACLNSITTDLEILEIGDCYRFSEEIIRVLMRFVNLHTLRLENCKDKWDCFAHRAFSKIGDLQKLNKLELINISFTNCVRFGLMSCGYVKQLLIIPIYSDDPAETIRLTAECLRDMSDTLVYVLWVLTTEMLQDTRKYASQSRNIINQVYSSANSMSIDNAPLLVPIFKTRSTVSLQSSQNINFKTLPFENFSHLMKALMCGGMRSDLIMAPFAETTFINLSQHVYEPPAI